GFTAAIRAGVPCVMVNHAFYRSLGARRASLEPATYRLLRGLGFEGVAITDSLDIVRNPPPDWPVAAIRAGADLLLFTNPKSAAPAAPELRRRRAGDLRVGSVAEAEQVERAVQRVEGEASGGVDQPQTNTVAVAGEEEAAAGAAYVGERPDVAEITGGGAVVAEPAVDED